MRLRFKALAAAYGLLLAGSVALALTSFWLAHDLYAFDTPGRIADAIGLYRYGWLATNPSFFGGAVQGGAYPPLDALLMGFCVWLAGGVVSGVDAARLGYLAYATLIVIATLAAAHLLLRPASPGRRFLGLLAFLAFYFSGDTGEYGATPFVTVAGHPIYLFLGGFMMGLRFVDHFMAGLTSQALSLPLLLVLLADVQQGRRRLALSAAVLLCYVHVVSALVGLLVLGVALAKDRSLRPTLREAALAGVALAPMLALLLAYAGDVTTATLVAFPSLALPWLFAAVLLLWGKERSIPLAALVLALLWLLSGGLTQMGLQEWLPPFHYVRLCPYVVLLSIAAALSEERSWVASAVLITVLTLIAPTFQAVYRAPHESYPVLTTPAPEGRGATLVVEAPWSSFSRLTGYLFLTGQRQRFASGLFWEQKRANVVLARELDALFTPHAVLVDQLGHDSTATRQSCEEYARRLDALVTRYELAELILPRLDEVADEVELRHKWACFAKADVGLTRRETFTFKGQRYELYSRGRPPR